MRPVSDPMGSGPVLMVIQTDCTSKVRMGEADGSWCCARALTTCSWAWQQRAARLYSAHRISESHGVGAVLARLCNHLTALDTPSIATKATATHPFCPQVRAEELLTRALEAEHRLLADIFPRHGEQMAKTECCSLYCEQRPLRFVHRHNCTIRKRAQRPLCLRQL